MAGESAWSKAQKNAVYALLRYTRSRTGTDFKHYQAAIAVTLGDRQAPLPIIMSRGSDQTIVYANDRALIQLQLLATALGERKSKDFYV